MLCAYSLKYPIYVPLFCIYNTTAGFMARSIDRKTNAVDYNTSHYRKCLWSLLWMDRAMSIYTRWARIGVYLKRKLCSRSTSWPWAFIHLNLGLSALPVIQILESCRISVFLIEKKYIYIIESIIKLFVLSEKKNFAGMKLFHNTTA